jgi:hypothetical protein
MRRERGTSGLVTAKSRSIKSAERKSGGCVPKAIELTSGDLCGCLGTGLRSPEGNLIDAQKSAEGVVGGEESLKAQTEPSQEGEWRG